MSKSAVYQKVYNSDHRKALSETSITIWELCIGLGYWQKGRREKVEKWVLKYMNNLWLTILWMILSQY